MVLIVFTLQAEKLCRVFLPPYGCFFNSPGFFRSAIRSLAIVNVNPSFSKSCFVSRAKLTQFVWFIINRVYSAARNLSIPRVAPTNAATINLVCLIVLSNKLKIEFFS